MKSSGRKPFFMRKIGGKFFLTNCLPGRGIPPGGPGGRGFSPGVRGTPKRLTQGVSSLLQPFKLHRKLLAILWLKTQQKAGKRAN